MAYWYPMRHQGQANLAHGLQAKHPNDARRRHRRRVRPAVYIVGVVANSKKVLPQDISPNLYRFGLAFKFNPGGIVKSNAHRPVLTDQT